MRSTWHTSEANFIVQLVANVATFRRMHLDGSFVGLNMPDSVVQMLFQMVTAEIVYHRHYLLNMHENKRIPLLDTMNIKRIKFIFRGKIETYDILRILM